MVTIREVKSDEKKIIDEIVTIHLNTFTGFFLTFMGRGFLRQITILSGSNNYLRIYITTTYFKIIWF